LRLRSALRGLDLQLPLDLDRRRRILVSRTAAAAGDRYPPAAEPGRMRDIEAGTTSFVLDQEAAEPLEHARLTAARLHLANGREPRRR
jgi:hypothetical protein